MTTTPSSLADDYRALREGCGLADLSDRGRLELLGADRQRFLNGYITCDVKALAPGSGAYGFLTSNQGRILADAVVLAQADRLWLDLPPGKSSEISGHLSKYILADQVEIVPLDDMMPLALIGPRAAEVLGEEAVAALGDGPWRHARVKVHGTEVALQRAERFGAPAFVLWVSASIARLLVKSLREDERVREVGDEALEVLRAEAGIARFGQDFGADNFPQETGAEEAAVSYTKGCYLGQEVVARIHYRGGVQKSLRGLAFEPGVAPRSGAALSLEGREVGAITTVADSPALGLPVGLAILHKRGAAAGTRLDVDGGGTAEVRDLPLVP
jgi:aminomethyltransferase